MGRLNSTTHPRLSEIPSKREFLAQVFQLIDYCEEGICTTRNFHIETLRSKVALVKQMAVAIREAKC